MEVKGKSLLTQVKWHSQRPRNEKLMWKTDEKYAFIIPIFQIASPVCLICNETVAVAKEYNLHRHNNAKHTNFKDSYPEQSEARQRKIAPLKSA